MPGHGPVMRDREYLETVNGLIDSLVGQVRGAVDQDITLDEIRGQLDRDISL